MLQTLLQDVVEAPMRFQRYIDGCTCGRADKAAITAIKLELEQKDAAIERLEEDIRRKDTEKDNLIHMQKDLQAQIEEIRRVLENHAAESMNGPTGDSEKAAIMMQSKVRGISGRRRVQQMQEEKKAAVSMQAKFRGDKDRKQVDAQLKSTMALQARARGINTRKQMDQRRADGSIMDLPGAKRMAEEGLLDIPSAAAGRAIASMPYADEEALDDAGGPLGDGFDDGSVDSDYDYDETRFAGLGLEVLSGKLTLAKVYGQEEPPAAEDELEWESRYFVLFDTAKMVHFDGLEDGRPVGDRGMIDLAQIKSVEKVLGVPTFVMKSSNKVYLFKIEPHDEVMMRTWIGAISVELNHEITH